MTPHLQLLLKMADLWVTHIQAAADENRDDAEISAELAELTSLRREVESIFNDRDLFRPDVPANIAAYLQGSDPECGQVTVEKSGEKWIVNTEKPVSAEAFAGLDQHWPGVIAMNQGPRST